MSEEKEALRNLDSFTLIKYIKTSIDILVDLRVEERVLHKNNISNDIQNTSIEEEGNIYEPLLRKLESDIRAHIKLEHQFKLHTESLVSKIEDLEKEKENLAMQNKAFPEVVLI